MLCPPAHQQHPCHGSPTAPPPAWASSQALYGGDTHQPCTTPFFLKQGINGAGMERWLLDSSLTHRHARRREFCLCPPWCSILCVPPDLQVQPFCCAHPSWIFPLYFQPYLVLLMILLCSEPARSAGNFSVVSVMLVPSHASSSSLHFCLFCSKYFPTSTTLKHLSFSSA